jgi:hypothetical protein
MAFIMERGGRAVGIGAPPSRGSRRRALALAEPSLMAVMVDVVDVVDVLAMVVGVGVGVGVGVVLRRIARMVWVGKGGVLV